MNIGNRVIRRRTGKYEQTGPGVIVKIQQGIRRAPDRLMAFVDWERGASSWVAVDNLKLEENDV